MMRGEELGREGSGDAMRDGAAEASAKTVVADALLVAAKGYAEVFVGAEDVTIVMADASAV